MALFEKIRGTIETIFQLGIGGPQLKDNGGNIDARDSGDAAYINVRGLDPVIDDDLTTKRYVDGAIVGDDAIQVIRFSVDGSGGAGTTDSVSDLPADSRVVKCRVEYTVAFDGAATIEVGKSGGSASLLQATTDNDASSTNAFVVDQDTDWGAGDAAVQATVAGAPTTGTAIVTAWYVQTPAT